MNCRNIFIKPSQIRHHKRELLFLSNHLLLVFLGEDLEHLGLLGSLSLLASLACLLHLRSTRFGLIADRKSRHRQYDHWDFVIQLPRIHEEIHGLPQHLRTGLASLLFVNVLHQDALVLEHVTLALQIQQVVPAKQPLRALICIQIQITVTSKWKSLTCVGRFSLLRGSASASCAELASSSSR